jgi:hypothetical protein
MLRANTGGFRMLPSYYDAIPNLPDAERLALYDAINDFGFGSGPGEEALPPTLAGYFLLIRPTLEKSVRFFESRRENGRKPKRSEAEAKGSEREANMKRDSESESEGDSDSESEGVSESEKQTEKTASPRAKRFTPPSVDEIREYCRQRQNSVDAAQFADYYAARGWRVGSGTMRDWRAAVRTWERRETNTENHSAGPRRSASACPGRDYGSLCDNDPGRAGAPV